MRCVRYRIHIAVITMVVPTVVALLIPPPADLARQAAGRVLFLGVFSGDGSATHLTLSGVHPWVGAE